MNNLKSISKDANASKHGRRFNSCDSKKLNEAIHYGNSPNSIIPLSLKTRHLLIGLKRAFKSTLSRDSTSGGVKGALNVNFAISPRRPLSRLIKNHYRLKSGNLWDSRTLVISPGLCFALPTD